MVAKSRLRPIRLAAAASVLAAFAAGCASSGHARRVDDDRRLASRVSESFAASPALSEAKIAAKAYAGVVALLGEVREEDVKREAESVASGVPGVVRVNNLILVLKGDSKAAGSAPAKDALVLARAP